MLGLCPLDLLKKYPIEAKELLFKNKVPKETKSLIGLFPAGNLKWFKQMGLLQESFELPLDLTFTSPLERSIMMPSPEVMTADSILEVLFAKDFNRVNEKII